MDKFTPFIGYLPGPMPWFFGQKLKEEGVNILFSTGSGRCHRDGSFITGDGPKAANTFGILCVESLLDYNKE